MANVRQKAKITIKEYADCLNALVANGYGEAKIGCTKKMRTRFAIASKIKAGQAGGNFLDIVKPSLLTNDEVVKQVQQQNENAEVEVEEGEEVDNAEK